MAALQPTYFNLKFNLGFFSAVGQKELIMEGEMHTFTD